MLSGGYILVWFQMPPEFETLTFSLPLAGSICTAGVTISVSTDISSYTIKVRFEFDPHGASVKVGGRRYKLPGRRLWRLRCGANAKSVKGTQVQVRFPKAQVKQPDQLVLFNNMFVSDMTVLTGHSCFYVGDLLFCSWFTSHVAGVQGIVGRSFAEVS